MAFITFTGNLGRDAELKYTKGGSPVMSFSVADSKSRKLDNGQWETIAEQWLECTIWGSLAEHYDGKLTKGTRVTVYGDFMSRKYDKKDGTQGISLDVNVKGVDILTRGGGQQQSGGGFGGQQQPAQGGGWGNQPQDAGAWGNGAAGDPPF